MAKFHSRKYLEKYRKSLRKNSTSAEATLWKSSNESNLNVENL